MLSLACLFVLWQIVGVASLLTNSLKKVQWWICTSWVQLMSWWSGWDKLLWHLTHVWIDLHFPGFVWGFWPWLWPRWRSNLSDPNRPLEALRVRHALVCFLPLARRRDCVLACMFSMTPPLWGCPLPWLWVINFKMLASQKWLFCLLFLYNNFEVWFQSLWANSTTLLLSCGIWGSSAINFLGYFATFRRWMLSITPSDLWTRTPLEVWEPPTIVSWNPVGKMWLLNKSKQHISINWIIKLPVCIAHSPQRVSGSVHSILAILLPETMLQIMINFCR